MSTPSSNADRALPRKRGRSVPAIYGIVSLVLVLGAVTFALSTPPPSTPPLAAVAPAPQEQLEVERVEQSSRFGEGVGGEGDCVPGDAGCEGVGEDPARRTQRTPPAPTPEPTPEPEPSDTVETAAPGEYRRCFNVGPNGPTQSPDPQSPACRSEIFQGDNGGATATGVTRETIRVAVPVPLVGDLTEDTSDDQLMEEENWRALLGWVRHVERYYELYGRSIELVPVRRPDDDGSAAEAAFAADVAAVEPFAVLSFESGSIPFYTTVADRNIIAFDNGEAPVSQAAVYDRFDPYVWGLFPPVEVSLLATGDLICRALAGHPAQHGGDEVAESPRRFGIVEEQVPGRSIEAAPLVNRIEGCEADHRVYPHGEDDDRETLLRRLRSDGVTTVVCLCHSGHYRFSRAAEAVGYQPEWLLPGINSFGHPQHMRTSGTAHDQRSHTFGLWAGFREAPEQAARGLRYEDYYWYHALLEQDPEYLFDPHSSWDVVDTAYTYYGQLMLLATGVQHAGPDLDPLAFGDGLRVATFPNPGVGAAPWFQPSVGFDPRAPRTFSQDFVLAWFDSNSDEERRAARSHGRYCYVGNGVRFTADALPADADRKFFDPEAGCR